MRILFIDDHTLFREAFAGVIRQFDAAAVILDARNAEDARRLAGHYRGLDMILLDLSLPDADGVALLDELQELVPNVPIIALSASEDPVVVRQVLEAGAAGYVPKSSNSFETIAALRVVMNGNIYIPPAVLASLEALDAAPADGHDQDRQASRERADDGGLTPREFDVLGLLGLTNKQIARQLGIEEGTVKIYVCNILRKLDVGNRRQAMLAALQRGMLLSSGAPTPGLAAS